MEDIDTLVRKIRRIQIRTGRLVDTLMAGQYQSAFKGAGIEFEEVREYVPGDDVRSIHPSVTARAGKPFIKRYREERELLLMLLVDMSGSGGFGTFGRRKRETAAETAAILATSAIRNNDRVGAIFFTDVVERFIPPKKGGAHIFRVIREILSHEPERAGTDLAEAVRFLGRVTHKRSVSFLISDFLDDGFENTVAAARRRHDLVGLVVTDPGDFSLPSGGILKLRDMETGEIFYLDGSDPESLERYGHAARAGHSARLDTLRRAGVDLVEISTAASPVPPLRRFFATREKRGSR